MEQPSRKWKVREGLLFMMPWALIRYQHLTRRDTLSVKWSLCSRMGIASIFTAILLTLFNAALLVSLSVQSQGQLVEVYGLFSLLGIGGGLGLAIVVIVLQIGARLTLNERLANILARIGTDLLFFAAALEMAMTIFTDAKMGFTVNVEALSPGIILVAVLLLVQPAFWLDAIVLNFWTSALLVSISLACHTRFGMGGIAYYIIVALGLPILGYLVVSILFFAETNHYVQAKQNEMLYNSAMYDELTKCKNRTSLVQFLKDNAKRWETHETHLLLILFDIDNFKQYNDQFSHPGGDMCLCAVCAAIRRTFPHPNLDFYRYGGEEFLLFFELDDPSEAASIMEEARLSVKDIKLPAPEGAPEEVVTISLGGTIIRTLGGFNFDMALRTVDGYLYRAKAAGKDVCCLDGAFVKKGA